MIQKRMAALDKEKCNPFHEAVQGKEDLMNLVRGEGPWQRRILLVCIGIFIPFSCHNLAMTFFAPNLDYWCARPPNSSLTVEEWKEMALPPNDKQCSRYKHWNISKMAWNSFSVTMKNETVSCDSWEYDDSVYKSTVLGEWNLVCDREWFISLSKSIFIAGYMCSVTVFGYLADKFGRRTVITICNAISVVSAIACAFSTSFFMFAIARFFVAVGSAGAFSTAFVLVMEVIGPDYRSLYGIGINAGWVFGYLILPGIVLLLKDWFHVQLVITIPSIVFLSSWWVLPESPRWLLTRGKTVALMQVLSNSAKTNGIHFEDIKPILQDTISKTSKVKEKEDSNANILQLLRPGLLRNTLIVFYMWCVVAFVYYGITYNTNELAGDPFVNYVAYGLVEVPAYVVTYYLIKSKGRRNPLAISLGAAGTACLLMYPIPDDPWWLGSILSLFGKFCITCAFGIIYVFTAEIFPTVVRNAGLGSASVSARIGSIIAPFVRELGKATHPVVPQLFFGILAASAGFLVLLLPETNNLVIPDTLQEASEIAR
ncbi:organic cation transporter protein-like isoform X1 [Argiope bruennichi]|uniref:organic cation transporter protein-like isoform X1 n=2 Tax=Argiope bruennichi TaxID=94029 RepID=UPI002493F888|nr:organic cation transporter protein-like isoform X1 [Argiope bruennichi]